MIKALIFDLDDTLYREKDFVESGYKAVALHLSKGIGCDFQQLYATMLDTLHSMGRHSVMNAVKKRCPVASIVIEDLVSIYRHHSPEIRMYPGYYGLLKELSGSYRLGIITDGMPEVQERKIRALRLEGLMDAIIYTWKFGREKQKPHPHSFKLMLQSLETEAENALFVGDNPTKDCTGAHRAGMKYAQIRPPVSGGEDLDSACNERPEYVIDSLFQLPPILQELK
ncbi:MAG: HAD family hydrolase [Acidobacteria bacterium]|nr:HAD family hydrolase [Acidobacteriota bacterium]